ncbi:hypothetical protein INQ45_10145 [Flavobacterium columnare]|uniref:hypothetical protein n=1 Tax=Flavobacterium columnare TaxID=996 RepID=UPI002D20A8BA|nr:hypothetical protein [Flavobacterium columnare]MEB3801404.1 hypothetical protein [Flavobacterium columnare]
MIINFIKKNISVFNLLAFLFFLFIIFINPERKVAACGQGFIFLRKIFFGFLALGLIAFDLVLKAIIKSRSKLNVVELIIFLLFTLLIFI